MVSYFNGRIGINFTSNRLHNTSNFIAWVEWRVPDTTVGRAVGNMATVTAMAARAWSAANTCRSLSVAGSSKHQLSGNPRLKWGEWQVELEGLPWLWLHKEADQEPRRRNWRRIPCPWHWQDFRCLLACRSCSWCGWSVDKVTFSNKFKKKRKPLNVKWEQNYKLGFLHGINSDLTTLKSELRKNNIFFLKRL